MKQMILLFSVLLAAAAWARSRERLPAAGTAALFETPEAAVAALEDAAKACDSEAFLRVFGPSAEDLQTLTGLKRRMSGNLVAAPWRVQAYRPASQTRAVRLRWGRSHGLSPFRWCGRRKWRSLMPRRARTNCSRRIGRNELSTLSSVRAYVEAQREYAAQDRDNDEVLGVRAAAAQHARRKGRPLLAAGERGRDQSARAAGRSSPKRGVRQGEGEDVAPEPFHGYFFKILTAQGKRRPAASTAISSTAT